MTRSHILKRIIEEQQHVIETLKQSVDHYVHASDIDEQATIDPDDLSQQVQTKDLQLRFENLLKEAEANLKFIETAADEPHTGIETGSIVETQDAFLFVGISVPKFEFEGKQVVSFSEKAPVFQQLRGKKIGETVLFGEKTLRIERIF